MMNHLTEVQIFDNEVLLGEALANLIADRIQKSTEAGKAFILGCPGGRTPVTTINALAKELDTRKLDLSRLVIAMMDEYVFADGEGWKAVDSDAHNSCRRFAREEIQAVLNQGKSEDRQIPNENVWLPDAAHPELYDEKLRKAGGINFFILASGASDGHVAFNPPGSELHSRTRIVKLAELTRRDNLSTFTEFSGLSEVPTHGVSVGIATIVEQTHEGALILVGSDKHLAFSRITKSDTFDPSWPASVVRLIKRAQIYADVSASASASETEIIQR
jgi:glucosamine-6-phosphate deaminase